MKTVKRTGIALAILPGMFIAYVGAYWFARKSDFGNEFFSSGAGAWQKAPEWLQRAEAKLFIPARDMEY
jgi:hypothetical protein